MFTELRNAPLFALAATSNGRSRGPCIKWPMAKDHRASAKLEVVEPIGARVLIRKDEDRKQTKAGIHLPDKIEIPTLTGRVVAISAQVERDENYPVKKYDRILFNPKHAIPVEFEGDNRLFVIPVEDVVAVFRRDGDDETK